MDPVTSHVMNCMKRCVSQILITTNPKESRSLFRILPTTQFYRCTQSTLCMKVILKRKLTPVI